MNKRLHQLFFILLLSIYFIPLDLFGQFDIPVPGEEPKDPVINEFVVSHTGPDTLEYVEILGDSIANFSSFTLIEIEGDGSGAGTIDGVFALSSANGKGIELIGFLDNELENGTITFLLVENFTGSVNVDLDTNNDGVLDTQPWNRIVDAIAVSDGGSSDLTYANVVLLPNFDGLSSFAPGGASRVPNGTDTDAVSDWVRNDFDLAGIQGVTGSPEEGEAFNTPGAVNQLVPATANDPVINEFVFNHTGIDTNEYIEIFGDPSTDYSGFSVIEIEGDFSTSGIMGNIDGVFPLGSTDANGFELFGIFNNELENGTITLLLVEDFSDSVNIDLDVNNDGVLDSAPWSRIVDAVAVSDGGTSDLTYANVVLGPNFDGFSSFSPGGASRIPNGTDTDAITDWVRNDFDLAGIQGFVGSPAPGEALNTPGVENQLVPEAPNDPVINEFVFNHTGD